MLIAVSSAVSLPLAPLFSLTHRADRRGSAARAGGCGFGHPGDRAEVGGAVGIAMLGSWGGRRLPEGGAAALPLGIPTNAGDPALGAAVAVARQLPAELRQVFLEVMREAFVHGLHVASAASSAIAFVAAVIALLLLRQVQPGHDPETHG